MNNITSGNFVLSSGSVTDYRELFNYERELKFHISIDYLLTLKANASVLSFKLSCASKKRIQSLLVKQSSHHHLRRDAQLQLLSKFSPIIISPDLPDRIR